MYIEITLLPAPGINFKTIGGIIDVFVFVGQNPNEVVQLYTSLIGNPLLPSYWALGFQITRYGYVNTSHVSNVIERNHKANIPMVSCIFFCLLVLQFVIKLCFI